jgi:hypothetical protein
MDLATAPRVIFSSRKFSAMNASNRDGFITTPPSFAPKAEAEGAIISRTLVLLSSSSETPSSLDEDDEVKNKLSRRLLF